MYIPRLNTSFLENAFLDRSLLSTTKPALVIIDCQEAIDEFDSSVHSNRDAEARIGELLAFWRINGFPIVHVRHSSKDPNSPYHRLKKTYKFKGELAPNSEEKVVTKSENCAFIGTDLHEFLQASQISELVVCGVLTHHSVDATVRHANALGYKVIVPENCTASFPLILPSGEIVSSEMVQEIFLENLNGEYCKVVSHVAL